MLQIPAAFDLLAQHVAPLPAEETALTDLLGRRLARDVVSGVDSPPFDKSMVDGYAIALGDAADELAVLEQVIAGGVPTQPLSAGGTIRVMTGAPVPAGAEAVVKWEDCRELAEDRIANPAAGIAAGHCILKQGTAFHRGETVLPAGKVLTPLDIALLAEIGQPRVAAVPRPTVGVLPTGNELIAADQPLAPGQIRNSNGPMLLASLAGAGVRAIDLGVARDEPAALRSAVERGLTECDVLLISGGVSAGVMDLVPGVLAALGVREVFHKLKMKPGKPLWFGVRDTDQRRQYVFGLPGNPVSTLVSFRLFVVPTLAALAGAPFAPPATKRCALSANYNHRGGRVTYHPCRTVDVASPLPQIEPLAWRGSADIKTLTQADCLGVFAAGDYQLAAGTEVDALPLN